MKTLFIGSKDLGVAALELFHGAGAEIAAVIARHDDPSLDMWYGSVTEMAQRLRLPVHRPADINAAEGIALIRDMAPDLVFTAFHPQIYSAELLSSVDATFLNLHFAPLPRYRGCMPGAWAIINGEATHGVTIHHMAPGVDDGDIAFQRTVPIDGDETGRSLYLKCDTAGAALLRDALPDILAGRIPATPQNRAEILYYPRGYPYGGVVAWGWEAAFIERYVRAMTFPPFRNPFTFVGGTKVFVDAVRVADIDSVTALPGAVMSHDPLTVQCGRGVIEITAHSFENDRSRARVDLATVEALGR